MENFILQATTDAFEFKDLNSITMKSQHFFECFTIPTMQLLEKTKSNHECGSCKASL